MYCMPKTVRDKSRKPPHAVLTCHLPTVSLLATSGSPGFPNISIACRLLLLLVQSLFRLDFPDGCGPVANRHCLIVAPLSKSLRCMLMARDDKGTLHASTHRTDGCMDCGRSDEVSDA